MSDLLAGQLLTRKLNTNSATWPGLGSRGHGHQHVAQLSPDALVFNIFYLDQAVLSEIDNTNALFI